VRRLRTAIRAEAGFTLIELITASSLMLVVLAGLGGMFVSSSNAELNANRYFQAQTESRVALERLRRDIRCATTITPTGAAASVTLVLPAGCTASSGSVTWCTQASGSIWELYRVEGASCVGGTRYAGWLTAATVFNFTAGTGGALGKLTVDLRIDTEPTKSAGRFHIIESLVPRNATRT
jgi:prepilin-type N-terminal cleavage/methylation domain-containing protein